MTSPAPPTEADEVRANDHGFRFVGTTESGAPVYVGASVAPRLRCDCRRGCLRAATEEDLLCDECRTDRICQLGSAR